jgi:hypothetical protein
MKNERNKVEEARYEEKGKVKEWLRGKVLGMFFCFIVFCIFAL